MVWRDVRVSQCGEIYPSLSRRAGWEALSAQERSEVVPAGSDKGPIREGPKSGAENGSFLDFVAIQAARACLPLCPLFRFFPTDLAMFPMPP